MSYKQYIQCRKCKNAGGKSIPPGFYRDKEVKNGIEYPIIKECLCHKNWAQTEKAYKDFIKNGFDKDYFEINMRTSDGNGDYIGLNSIGSIVRLYNYINRFYEDEKVRSSLLYFYGAHDTQKTAIANWIGNKLIRKYNVTYSKFSIFFEKYVYEMWNPEKDENVNYFIEQCENCDLMILDDFDDNVFTDKQSLIFEKFLNKRISLNKGSIIISTQAIKDLKSQIKELLSRETKKINSEFQFKDFKNDIPTELF